MSPKAITTNTMALKNLKIIRHEFQSSFSHLIHNVSSHINSKRHQIAWVSSVSKYQIMANDVCNFNYAIDKMDFALPSTTRFNPLAEADKRQYAIYELFNSEINLYFNLNKIIHLYQKPMLDSKLISADESNGIFANLTSLLKIHQSLIENLASIQFEGKFACPATVMADFVESLREYEPYCLNIYKSKKLVRKKMKTKLFSSFLNSELVQKYSEKIDLLSYLDQPRRHLMNYPLLLNAICNKTTDEADVSHLQSVISSIRSIIMQIDDKIAEQKCQHLMSKFQFFSRASSLKSSVPECKQVLLKADVHQLKRFKPKLKLILLDQFLVVAKQSLSGKKLLVLAAIGKGSELHYSCGKSKSHCHGRFQMNVAYPFGKRVRRSSNVHRPSGSFTGASSTPSTKQRTTLRLYSTVESFDISVKFRNQDEVNNWLNKLRPLFKLAKKCGAFRDLNNNSSSSSSSIGDSFSTDLECDHNTPKRAKIPRTGTLRRKPVR